MTSDSRLNLLITHVDKPHAGAVAGTLGSTVPWYKTLAHLLAPLGVRTYETSQAERALSLIEAAPIHLAVVDTRLSAMEGLDVLRMIQKMRERAAAQRPATPPASPKALGFRVEVKLDQQPTGQRVEVKFVAGAGGSRKPVAPPTPVPAAPEPEAAWPAVILLTPHRNEAILHQAMALSAFSVVSEPVDLNLMLELMARVLKRFHQNQWPRSDTEKSQ